MTTFHPTTATFKQGARTMPGEYYTSPEIFARDRESIHARRWNCVGRASALPRPGDYLLADVAGESLIVVRDRNGEPHAFFNVCRHRGTRLCTEPSGHVSETIQCPYHAWTYTTDGRLIGAPHMKDVAGFARADYGLHAAALAEWNGFLFAHVGDAPTPFHDEWAPALERLSRFPLADLVVGHDATYHVRANWKLVFQNYSECLHCPTIHPELSVVLPYDTGANDLTEGAFLGGYMEIRAPHESATLTGRACALPVHPGLPEEERRRAYYYTLLPNLLLSIHPDYVNYYTVTPVAADRTIVRSQWLFHPESAADPRFHPDDAIRFWDVTNRQDWEIVERSQLGVASRRYVPGPYSARESMPAAWDREYLRLVGRWDGEGVGRNAG